MNINKKIIFLIILITLILCAGLYFVFSKNGGAIITANKGTCITETKNSGRQLLVPLYPNNTPLSFETGAECNILPRLKQGSIVLYISPRGPDPITLKVAGLPGDTIDIDSGNKLTINGTPFTNSKGTPYILNAADQRTNINKIKTENVGKIPQGFYFLMGDNDKIFLDSSRFGLSDGKDILGILSEQ